MQKLKRLIPQFRSAMSEAFLAGREDIDVDVRKYVKDFAREIDLTPLVNVVGKAMEKFPAKPEESDRWLAPRVHATLRLTRREAADQAVWDYLAIFHLKDYVLWRWKRDERVGPERFAGREYNKHAIARLWWGAEVTRNGDDYEATSLLFVKQDVQNSWFKTRLFRHRPTAIASLKYLSTFSDGSWAGDEQRTLVKSLNMALTTTMLDAVADNPAVDADGLIEWQTGDINETEMFEQSPLGPPEQKLPEKSVEAVTQLLRRITSKTKFTKRDRNPGKGDTPGE